MGSGQRKISREGIENTNAMKGKMRKMRGSLACEREEGFPGPCQAVDRFHRGGKESARED